MQQLLLSGVSLSTTTTTPWSAVGERKPKEKEWSCQEIPTLPIGRYVKDKIYDFTQLKRHKLSKSFFFIRVTFAIPNFAHTIHSPVVVGGVDYLSMKTKHVVFKLVTIFYQGPNGTVPFYLLVFFISF